MYIIAGEEMEKETKELYIKAIRKNNQTIKISNYTTKLSLIVLTLTVMWAVTGERVAPENYPLGEWQYFAEFLHTLGTSSMFVFSVVQRIKAKMLNYEFKEQLAQHGIMADDEISKGKGK